MQQPVVRSLDHQSCVEAIEALRSETYFDEESGRNGRWNRGKVHDLQDLPRRLDAIFERFGLAPSEKEEAGV